MVRCSFPMVLLVLVGCGSGHDEGDAAEGPSSGGPGGSSTDPPIPDTPVEGVGSECGSVRMTQYSATERRWCGFDRASAILPDFVRRGMTVAIAEPYDGSSYDGDAGEACGECWQVDTSFGSEIVMVHDLCPIEGNPICAGSHFHFDVSSEVASALDGDQWLGEGAVTRVPCPVTGNIHAYVSDRNEWGYLKLAFFNHRYPIRTVEYRPSGEQAWLPMERCLARWCAEDDAFSEGGPGATFRISGAHGEQIEGGTELSYDVGVETDLDTGLQFSSEEDSVHVCEFAVPGAVYVDGWGGISGVKWTHSTWGDTSLVETDQNCHTDSESCLLLEDFAESGVHLTYRHTFPMSEFSTLSLWVRTEGASGNIDVAPRTEESRCSNSTTAQVSGDWTEVEIDLTAACPEASELHGLTVSFPSEAMDLLLDDVHFVR